MDIFNTLDGVSNSFSKLFFRVVLPCLSYIGVCLMIAPVCIDMCSDRTLLSLNGTKYQCYNAVDM